MATITMTTVRIMMQGYGLTECCSTACIPDGEDLSTGRVGPPLQVPRNINIMSIQNIYKDAP